MKHFEGLRKWGKKIEIKIFDKWLIPLDRVTFVHIYLGLSIYLYVGDVL